MIKAKNISFAYEENSVLKNISFEIDDGDFVALIGPNGAGKTTLEIILGLIPMQKGELEIFGKKRSELKENSIIGYVPQRYNIDKLFPGTVYEILHTIKYNGKLIHSQLGINELMNKKFVELSGGQQQRVLIALALQKNPQLLIFDEPTVGVDTKTQTQFLQLLKHINKEHKITILLITHDVGMVPQIANKVLCISHNVCCIGDSKDTHELIKKVYGEHIEHHHHTHTSSKND